MTKEQSPEIMIKTTEVEWRPLGPGTSYKLLRVSEETGTWSAILKMEAGAIFAPHRHLGAAEFFILQGSVKDRSGIQLPGSYGYEPIGTVHEATTALEESLIHFTAHGPIGFFDEKGGIGMMLDWEFFVKDREAAQNPQYSYRKQRRAA